MIGLGSWQGLADRQYWDPAQLGPYLGIGLLSGRGVTIGCFRGLSLHSSLESGSSQVESISDSQLRVV